MLAYLYGAFYLVMEINAIIDFRPFCFYKKYHSIFCCLYYQMILFP
ncbi:hypothetical protein AD17_0441 [Escherichia coli 3-373-03_S4_C2]|nr:hypothetical protein AD17_0441 [Escherichia coli 3-373-03_S4_C2]